MAARGTRRPHVRRVRSKPVRVSRRAARPKAGCAVVVIALAALPTILAAWLGTR